MATVLPRVDEIEDLQPSAITRRLAGDARLMGGSGYALLLQVAHPVVGAGVSDHSDFQADPWGRLIRTLDYVNVTVFGGAAAAAAMGARTRAVHHHIKGTLPNGEPYHSLEPNAFAWVHATLAHSILRSNDLYVGRVSQADREAFYADWRRLGRYIGVRDRDLPETYAEFGPYVAEMEAGVLERTQSVDDVLVSLMRPKRPDPRVPRVVWKALRWPAARSVRLTTYGMLGPVVRERLGLAWSPTAERAFRAFAASQRAASPVLPRQAKQFGPTYLRVRSEALARQGFAVTT
ncbi:MAG: hypothetical protein QOF76_2241 [Solirubrobacteraceae bacterium]|jgi:uncharacterized protein (DUF2236 family)|nr:hypothetical protein [Solirubrobacteraceae bacterium]